MSTIKTLVSFYVVESDGDINQITVHGMSSIKAIAEECFSHYWGDIENEPAACTIRFCKQDETTWHEVYVFPRYYYDTEVDMDTHKTLTEVEAIGEPI